MSVMELSVYTLSEAMDAAITTPRKRIQWRGQGLGVRTDSEPLHWHRDLHGNVARQGRDVGNTLQ